MTPDTLLRMDPRVQPRAAIGRLDTRLLINRLDRLTDAARLGALTFLVQHDSYPLGRLALLREPTGLPAVTHR